VKYVEAEQIKANSYPKQVKVWFSRRNQDQSDYFISKTTNQIISFV